LLCPLVAPSHLVVLSGELFKRRRPTAGVFRISPVPSLVRVSAIVSLDLLFPPLSLAWAFLLQESWNLPPTRTLSACSFPPHTIYPLFGRAQRFRFPRPDPSRDETIFFRPVRILPLQPFLACRFFRDVLSSPVWLHGITTRRFFPRTFLLDD